MIKSYNFGHQIYYKNGWKYIDNNESIYSDRRKCRKCNKYQTKKQHDPCLGKIPNVISACCGHGIYESIIIYDRSHK